MLSFSRARAGVMYRAVPGIGGGGTLWETAISSAPTDHNHVQSLDGARLRHGNPLPEISFTSGWVIKCVTRST